MQLIFDSVDEVVDFVKTKLKGQRGGKADKDDDAGTTGAPAPLAPPVGGAAGFPGTGTTGFAPPAAGATPGAGAFPAQGATGLAPEAQAIVNRIVTKVDGAVASGQPVEAVATWLRNHFGGLGHVDAASATIDQLKQIILPRLTIDQLNGTAKLLNA